MTNIEISIADTSGDLDRDLRVKEISLTMPEGAELARTMRLYGGLVETAIVVVKVVKFSLNITGLDESLKAYAKALWGKFKDYSDTITIGGQEVSMDPDAIETALLGGLKGQI